MIGNGPAGIKAGKQKGGEKIMRYRRGRRSFRGRRSYGRRRASPVRRIGYRM